MAITQAYTGSVSISTTEISLVSGTSTLQSVATPAVIQVFIDVANMAAGDEYHIDIKEKVTSGGTQRTIYTAVLDGAQSSPFVSPTLMLYHGWDVTVVQISGTARTLSWSIRSVG